MSTTVQCGPHWHGMASLKRFVIFGDSYSDINYDHTSLHPTPESPLGVKYPGRTFAGRGQPNWVGYLVTKYMPHSPVLVYDYAVGGDTVSGVHSQITHKFMPYLGKKPDWAPWTAEDTLFITWVGINDCAWMTDHNKSMETLFCDQEQLYSSGARNFIFVDVPPIHRSPAASAVVASGFNRYHAWNIALKDAVQKFSSLHPDTTTMIFSSWDVFSDVLDNPSQHILTKKDISKAGGAIWVDRLHPTSKIHDIVAKQFSSFLYAQSASSSTGDLGEVQCNY